MKTIIIETRGGLIDAVYSDQKDLKARILDWDEVEGAKAGEAGAVPVTRISVTRTRKMPAAMAEILKEYGREGP